MEENGNKELGSPKRTVPWPFETAFVFGVDTEDNEYVIIDCGEWDWRLELKRLRKPLDLLYWIVHFGTEGWPNVSEENIGFLVEAICIKKGWDLFEDAGWQGEDIFKRHISNRGL